MLDNHYLSKTQTKFVLRQRISNNHIIFLINTDQFTIKMKLSFGLRLTTLSLTHNGSTT